MTHDLREWLEPDGAGGYAMGTAAGIRTRRYHALLCAATRPPHGRMVLVNAVEAFVELAGGRRSALSSHLYRGGMIHPDGASRIVEFAFEPWPRWEYLLEDGSRLVHEVLVPRGGAGVMLRWKRDGGAASRRRGGDALPRRVSAQPATLSVRPLLSGRDFHALHRENSAFRFDAEIHGVSVVWRPYPDVPAIRARANGGYRQEPDWYRDFVYSQEAARGFPCEEDLAAPGVFTFEIDTEPAVLVFAAGEPDVPDGAGVDLGTVAERAFAVERARRASLTGVPLTGVPLDGTPLTPTPLTSTPLTSTPLTSTPLMRAADAYLVEGTAGETIIAGYPWFGAWGRDTFIALRGLCLATRRVHEARRILLAWCDALSAGMLPNRFAGSAGMPEYNSVDASLWFVVAADALLSIPEAVGTNERRALEEAVDDIVASYCAGTRHGIRSAPDGLLRCGEAGTQVTWMDARVHGLAVTPRVGKPVEVQALWINALAIAARRDGRSSELLAQARASFAARFWNPARRMLYDVVDAPDVVDLQQGAVKHGDLNHGDVKHAAGAHDERCRPNQIFAVGGGLPLALIEGERARAVVDAVERELWTPAGLRTLARGELGYAGTYCGGPAERDAAYHQGTVWTWLAGPFIEAWVRVRGGGPDAKSEARRRFFEPLLARAELGGLGHLGEIADAEPPHAPRGCPFQAWSVAEALRVGADVLGAWAPPVPRRRDS